MPTITLPCGCTRDVRGDRTRKDKCTACWRRSPEGREYNRNAVRRYRAEVAAYEAGEGMG